MCEYCENHKDLLICPYCLEITEKGIEHFGNKMKALAYINLKNIDEGNNQNMYINVFKTTMEDAFKKRTSNIMEKNGLVYENEMVRHKCGHILLRNFRSNSDFISDLELKLNREGFKYCPYCGVKLCPMDKDVDIVDSLIDKK